VYVRSTCIGAHTCLCSYVYRYMYVPAYTHTYTHTYIYIHICIYIHTYKHANIYTYVHSVDAHARTHTQHKVLLVENVIVMWRATENYALETRTTQHSGLCNFWYLAILFATLYRRKYILSVCLCVCSHIMKPYLMRAVIPVTAFHSASSCQEC
jgi:hypothetical protein